MSVRGHVSIEALLHQPHYTPQELAELLEVSPYLIWEEACSGRLQAFIVDHRVVSLRREDVLRWLRERS